MTPLAQEGVDMPNPERGAGWSMFTGIMPLPWGGWQALLGVIALLQTTSLGQAEVPSGAAEEE